MLLPLLTVALTLTALLAASAPARAAQLDLVAGGTLGSPGLYPYQQWVDDSYAPTYPGVVQLTFSAAPFSCGIAAQAAGCTSWSEWPIPQVEVDTGNGPYLAHQYEMHELGHVFDATEMQDPFRAQFMAIWGLSGGASAWWTPFGNDNASAGEWFAESYKLCALYGPEMPYEAWMTDTPAYGFPGDRDSAQQDASCQLMQQVGAAAGLPAPPSPTLYGPRILVHENRKAAECRGNDLLLPVGQVRCEVVGGGAPAGPWNVVLETPHMSKVSLRRARLAAVNGRLAFALARR
ncbi:MAG TPA: hypothetical protein VMB27_19725 [Solirubrobacteraceae bacterium]|nr:hypothetical protein [Solirubrobacteraceae bacterium]